MTWPLQLAPLPSPLTPASPTAPGLGPPRPRMGPVLGVGASGRSGSLALWARWSPSDVPLRAALTTTKKETQGLDHTNPQRARPGQLRGRCQDAAGQCPGRHWRCFQQHGSLVVSPYGCSWPRRPHHGPVPGSTWEGRKRKEKVKRCCFLRKRFFFCFFCFSALAPSAAHAGPGSTAWALRWCRCALHARFHSPPGTWHMGSDVELRRLNHAQPFHFSSCTRLEPALAPTLQQ